MVGTKLEVISVDYSEIDQLAHKVYGHEFNMAEDQESTNYSYKLFMNINGQGIDDYDQKKLDEFKSTGAHNFLADTLLKDLCRQGHLKPGNYLVDISW